MGAAAELLRELTAAGVVVSLDGGDLLCRPSRRLAPAHLDALRAHKPELVALLAAAPVIVAQALDPAQAGERLAPFLDRTCAELAGVYCRPLAWPDGGALVADPGDHWRRYGDRLADVADVLRPLALAYATPPDGWPVAPHLYLWEYSRLVAWFKADPCELPAQVEAWRGTVTPYLNPLMNPAFFDGHKAQEGPSSPPEVQRDDRA